MGVQNFKSQPDGWAGVNHIIYNYAIHPRYIARDFEIFVNHLMSQLKFFWWLLNLNKVFREITNISTDQWLSYWRLLSQRFLMSKIIIILFVFRRKRFWFTPVVNHCKLQFQWVSNHNRSLSSPFIWRNHHAVLPVGDILLDPLAE